MKKFITVIISLIMVLMCLTACQNSNNGNTSNTTDLKSGSWTGTIGDKEVTLTGAYLIDGEEVTLTEGEYESTTGDENVFLVVNGGKLTIKNSKITKTGESDNDSKSPSESTTQKNDQNNESAGSNENSNEQPPEPPKDENGNPMKPENNNEQDDSNGQPPELPSNSNGDTNKPDGEPPEKSSDNNPSSNNMQAPPQGGENSNEDAYNFYGKNSAIVCVGEGSSIIIEDCEITTDAEGSNAVFSTAGATIDVNNITINTSKNSSRGLYSTYGGSVTAKNVNIATKGSHCANLATDRGGGSVAVSGENNTFKTEGEGSPIVYSTGDISVENGTGTSAISETVVIEGLNKINLENCDFTSDSEKYAIMLYQSTSGDATDEDSSNGSEGCSSLIMKNSKITYNGKGEIFHITNTITDVNMDNVEFNDCDTFISAGADRWGQENKNGGTLTMSVNNMKISGKVIADDISKITLNIGKKAINNTETEGSVEVN